MASGRELSEATGHTAHVYGVAVSPDGRMIASAGRNAELLLWTVDDTESRRSLSRRFDTTDVGLRAAAMSSQRTEGQRWHPLDVARSDTMTHLRKTRHARRTVLFAGPIDQEYGLWRARLRPSVLALRLESSRTSLRDVPFHEQFSGPVAESERLRNLCLVHDGRLLVVGNRKTSRAGDGAVCDGEPGYGDPVGLHLLELAS